jgi:hypothetical protein
MRIVTAFIAVALLGSAPLDDSLAQRRGSSCRRV